MNHIPNPVDPILSNSPPNLPVLRLRGVAVIALVFILASTLGYLVVRAAVNKTVERQALA